MSGTTRTRFLNEYPKSLAEDAGAVFVGAGVSVGAGYPSWQSLLKEIGEELGVNSADVYDLAALAQWHVRSSSGYTRIRQVIRAEVAPEHALPETLQTIARFPIRHIWTTNYDRLIERAFSEIGRPVEAISASADLSLRARPGAVRLYKMHGSVDRLDDIVIATDDYELFRKKRGAYLPLLQAHLTSFSMLFIGLSFTDPNVRHVLSLIRESFTEAPPEHFALVRPPHRPDFRSDEEFQARLRQHTLWADDLKRYGLMAVEVSSFDEIPGLLKNVERRVARDRVWISGSWPITADDNASVRSIHDLSVELGEAIGKAGYSLVSGAGTLVGPASIDGFLRSLRRSGAWDLDRRLIVRPFPPAFGAEPPNRAQWRMLRKDLARLSGTVVFIGGLKNDGGAAVEADGVHEEFEIARAQGAFLLPIGATGGAAESIAKTLIGSSVPSAGQEKQRPLDAEIQVLLDKTKTRHELLWDVMAILKSVGRP